MKKISIRGYKPQTGLEKATKKILLENTSGIDVKAYLKDLFEYGCASGIVCGLIYHWETVSFYKKNKTEIADLLLQVMSKCGVSCPTELFGDTFDADDLLCAKTNNQNLLAWFAFERTAKIISERIGIDVCLGVAV